MTNTTYKQLKQIFEKYYTLNNINSLMTWDMSVKMPASGYKSREKQLSTLEEITSSIIDSKQTKALISSCNPNDLSKVEKRNFLLMKRIYDHNTSIDSKLRTNFLKASLKSEFIWHEAKKENNFKLFNQYFSKTISLLREISLIKSDFLQLSPYETLLDLYHPNLKEKDIDSLFNNLKTNLPPLISKITSKQAVYKYHNPIKIPIAIQRNSYKKIIRKLGLQPKWSRIDESSHPFCTGYPGDVRITTRYLENDFISGLMGLIHETGHALYDNNLPKSLQFQSIGEANGMSLHESQSLFMEMQIARSDSFIKFIYPILKKELSLPNSYDQTQLYHSINKVEKGYIRINADEVTYPMHIIMRYEIEKELIYNKISTSDLPEIWNNKLKTYFDLKPPKDSDGCLQDIHWSDGSLGYFPTYTIGAIYAAQIASRTKELLPEFNSLIESGNFKPIINILKDNIHNYASTISAQEIIEQFSGKKLDVNNYISYIENKYSI